MNIELWDVSRPRPYERNPRKLPETAIKKVAGSIKAFGFRSPIVVDEQGVILAGHTRLEAAKHLGLRQVPVHVAAGLTPGEAKAYRLADNRVAQETDWLEDALRHELDELASLGFDLDLTGFDMPELNRLLHSEADIERAEDTPEPPAIPVSIPGDLWLLGRHRLLCGDATVATDVEMVLAGVKPHLMVTDPPYGVEYDAAFRNAIARPNGKPIGARAVGKVLNDDKADWRDAWALFPGDVAYVWHAGRFANVVQDSLEACGFAMRAQIIWAKNNIAIGRGDYHWQHEPCWYAVRSKAKGHWQGDRKQSTLWKIDKPLKSETGHSTQKPIDCMKRPIENNSAIGQAVYEPFSGSGTTLMAGELTGRAIHAIELNPAYVDVAVMRWQTFTGQAAIHADGGKSYDDIKEARSVRAEGGTVGQEPLGERHTRPRPGGQTRQAGETHPRRRDAAQDREPRQDPMHRG